jgi:hypothetical protein
MEAFITLFEIELIFSFNALFALSNKLWNNPCEKPFSDNSKKDNVKKWHLNFDDIFEILANILNFINE